MWCAYYRIECYSFWSKCQQYYGRDLIPPVDFKAMDKLLFHNKKKIKFTHAGTMVHALKLKTFLYALLMPKCL